MSKRNLDDFLNLPISEALFIVLDVSFVSSTILMPIVFYLIFHVKSIGKYRWYVLNGIIWDYLYDVFLALWKPVTFMPIMAACSDVRDSHPVYNIRWQLGLHH